MVVGNRVLHSTTMFRRGAAIGVGGYDPRWFPAEDYDLWLRLLQVGEFNALDTAETSYTVNPDGISARHSSDQGDKELIDRGATSGISLMRPRRTRSPHLSPCETSLTLHTHCASASGGAGSALTVSTDRRYWLPTRLCRITRG